VLREFFDPGLILAEIDRVLHDGLVSSLEISNDADSHFPCVPMILQRHQVANGCSIVPKSWQRPRLGPGSRTHRSLATDAPVTRLVQRPEAQEIAEIPQIGGLRHRYQRRAA
jgi:hypothetical protein